MSRMILPLLLALGCTGDEDCLDETPYDGTDQDCDGFDLVDVDGDGHAGIARDEWSGPDGLWPPEMASDEDCDDDDPNVHPGAEDAPYDGVDADCAGDDDWDADDDNFIPDEQADGYPGVLQGGDCDDSNPDIHPAAPERVPDDVDDDCSGSTEPRWTVRAGFTGMRNLVVDATDTQFVLATGGDVVDGIDDVGVGFVWPLDMGADEEPTDQVYWYGVTTDDPLGDVSMVAGGQSFFPATSVFRDGTNVTLVMVKTTFFPSTGSFERLTASEFGLHDAPLDGTTVWWDGGPFLRVAACGSEAAAVMELPAGGTFIETGFSFTEVAGAGSVCAFSSRDELLIGDRTTTVTGDLEVVETGESPLGTDTVRLRRDGDTLIHIDGSGTLTLHPDGETPWMPSEGTAVLDAAVSTLVEPWVGVLSTSGDLDVITPDGDLALDPPVEGAHTVGLHAANERVLLAIGGESSSGEEILAWSVLAPAE